MIRLAELSDLPRMVDMGMRFLASTPRYAGKIEGNPVFLEHHFLQIMTSENAVLFVYGEHGDAHGMIAALHSVHQHSGVSMVAELFWWVEPERRGCGLKLYREMMRWARIRGAQVVQMTANSKKVGKLYKRLGFAPLEEVYIKKVD